MIEIKGVDPTMIANNLVPENPTHPGEVLKEELESRNITQKSFADKTGLSRSVVSDVLNGRRGVNTEYALLFEAILGIDAELWLRMQARYDMAKVKRNKSFMERLENIRKVAAAF
jgi:addiction module HigA family antidote